MTVLTSYAKARTAGNQNRLGCFAGGQLIFLILAHRKVIWLLGFRDITTFTKEAFFEKTGLETVTVISGGFGLPKLAFWLLGKVQDLRYFLQDTIYG